MEKKDRLFDLIRPGLWLYIIFVRDGVLYISLTILPTEWYAWATGLYVSCYFVSSNSTDCVYNFFILGKFKKKILKPNIIYKVL